MGAEHVKPRTYFDIVSIDALQQIIRHLSERPRTASWHEHVPPSAAGMLYSTQNSLCDAAAQSFTALNALNPTNLQPGQLRVTTEANCYLPIALRAVPHVIRHLSLGHRQPALSGHDWLDTLRTHAHSLRSLDLRGAFNDDLIVSLLEATGERVRTLHINCRYIPVVHALVKHCTALTELAIFARNAPLDTLWPALGGRLRSLSFLSSVRTQEELHAIEKHCTALHTLELVTEGRHRNLDVHIAALYASYAVRLRHAKLARMSADLCTKVVAACPNLRVSATIADNNMVRSVAALAPRLEKLKLDVHANTRTANLSNELTKACLLRELHIFFRDMSFAPDFIAALFSAPLRTVKVLEIGASSACLPFSNLARSTGALVRLKISNLSDFPDLSEVGACNANLQRVAVEMSAPHARPAAVCAADALVAMESVQFCRHAFAFELDMKMKARVLVAFEETVRELSRCFHHSHRFCSHSAVINGFEIFS